MIPRWIAEKYEIGEYCGNFSAATLFMDISGFTAITTRLMQEGKEGAEVLSEIVNNVFTPIVSAIHQRGGSITGFAGDALTAVFPGKDEIASVYTAVAIQKIFDHQGLQKTRLGEFELSVKIGLSYGMVDWGILGSNQRNTYYFKGEGIDGCARSEHHCTTAHGIGQSLYHGDIILDNNLYEKVATKIRATQREEGMYRFEHFIAKETLTDKSDTPMAIDEITLSKFVPQSLLGKTQTGEFRNIVSVFISFLEPPDFKGLNTLVCTVIDESIHYGGNFNKMDFGDKGGTMLIFFGAPVSYEDNTQRAIQFITVLKDTLRSNIRAGITEGIAYFGLVGSQHRCEYTCLGDVVNLSARLMMKAGWGDIWLTKIVKDKIQHRYTVKELGVKPFKGKPEPIAVYELLEKKMATEEHFYYGEMLGRQTEYEQLKNWCQPILEGSFGGIVYVYGEAGIGKSRVVHQVADSFLSDAAVYTLQTDSILRLSLNPIIYGLNRMFNLSQRNTDSERKRLFEERYEKLLTKFRDVKDGRMDALIKELQRTRSVLAALLGLRWEDSLFERLDAKGRYENTMFAIKHFFMASSLVRPIVLILEDIHCLDSDTKDCFTLLCRNIPNYPIVIFANSRPNDDGSWPKLPADSETVQHTMIIEALPHHATEGLIEQQLKGKADTELANFIQTRSLGNPFYIEQFCLYLRENEWIEWVAHRYKLKTNVIDVPMGIHAILMARIDRLSQELKDTVQIASVLGREVDMTILYALIGLFQKASIAKATSDTVGREVGKEQFEEWVDGAEKEQIWTNLTQLKYIFRHALLRDTIYDMQLRERLRSLHRLTAEIIERSFNNKAEKDNEQETLRVFSGDSATTVSEIAFHYDKGEYYEKAAYYYEKAGDDSRDHYRNSEAIAQYSRLLELITEKKKVVEVQNKLGSVLDIVGRFEQAETIFQSSIAIAQQLQQPKLLAESKRSLGWLMMKKGSPEAFTLLGDAASIAETTGDKELFLSGIYRNMGVAYYYSGELEKSMHYFELQKKKCVELGDQREYAQTVGSMGSLYDKLHEPEKAMSCYEEQKQISLKLGDKKSYSMAINNIGDLYRMKGDYETAIQYFEEAKKVSFELGIMSYYSMAINNMGEIYHEKGEFEKALQCFDEAIPMMREIGMKRMLCAFLNRKTKSLLEIRELEKAKTINEEALRIANEIHQMQDIHEAMILKHILNREVSSLADLLLQDYPDEEQKALIHYELFRITGEKQFGKIALEFYQELYEKAKKPIYKKHIDELHTIAV